MSYADYLANEAFISGMKTFFAVLIVLVVTLNIIDKIHKHVSNKERIFIINFVKDRLDSRKHRNK